MIDWLFEVCKKLKVQDKTVLYQAVSLMDRFYEASDEDFPTKDLQLTAVTCLFIASKNLEVEPLDLQTCTKTLCFNKFTKVDFLSKEAAIRKAVGF